MTNIDKSKPVGVIGAGTMGCGIVQVFAQSGFDVQVFDADSAAIDRATGHIKKMLTKAAEKGKIEASVVDETLGHIHPVGSLKEIGKVQICIEAATENHDIKKQIFKTLDEVLDDATVRASNTSSISITALAAVTKAPNRFIGMHFFNPVPLMTLVEVVMGLETDEPTFQYVHALAEAVGKTPLKVQDHPGFVSNRVLMPLINEAVLCLQDGVADAETIDGVMKLGMAHPMGPLRLADLIGLDVCHDIMMVLYRDLGDAKFFPAPLLAKMVAAGRLGNKTKRGFYSYE
jgi:3-hydroxybutyryl-CoA dehydrogenase